MAILPVGIGSAEEGGYQIERSLRFNSPDNTYLQRTPASSGSATTGTTSFWTKRSNFTLDEFVYSAAAAGHSSNPQIERMSFTPDNVFEYFAINNPSIKWRLATTAVYRDPSAWYHFVVVRDTNNATSSDRIRIYVNGVRVTTFSIETYPSSGEVGYIGTNVQNKIGEEAVVNRYNLNGYLTEINFIDGSALDPTSFGEFNEDTGVWQPIEYTGSYGTNGFYLNFSDNSGVTSRH
jgi:hypothetical protein